MRALGILGAIAALLAAYLLFFDRDPRDQHQQTDGRPLLAAFDRAAVRRLTVARAGAAPFDLLRTDLGWRIAPEGAPAATGAVEDLLAALDQAESTRAADLAAASAGLSPARVTLRLDDGAHSVELRLGNPDASGRGVFVQGGAGAPIRVGPRRLLDLADRPAADFRDARLFPLSADTVASVAWRTGPAEREHRWDRTGRDGWRNAAGARLGTDRVAGALRLLTDLRGARTSADAGTIADDGAWIELRAQGGSVARVTGSELPPAAREDVWHALKNADAPDLRLLSIPLERVRRIVVEDGERRLALTRDGAAQPWRFDLVDAPFAVEQGAVADWLARLASTSIIGVAKTGRRLIVDDRTEDAVTVGRSDPAFSLLDPDPLRFRSRKVLDFAHFDVREVKRAGGGVAFDIHSTDGETWTNPQAGTPIDRDAADRLVSAMGNLHAESLLAAAPRIPPQMALDVAVQPPGAPVPRWHRLELWNGCVGRVDGELAFRIDRAPCDELRLNPTPKR